MSRAWNFSAGPAVLPESVLAQLQEVLLEFGDTQAGLMEISHRLRCTSELVLRNSSLRPDFRSETLKRRVVDQSVIRG